jgi:UDP-N-acetylglucosamine 4-epimerase
LELIGLRYFNVFGRRQDPNGAYAAAIPKFIQSLMNYQSPLVHGDGLQTRDFTYIENVILANELAATTTNPDALNQVFNVAYGEQTTLIDLIENLKLHLSKFNTKIADVKILFGEERIGDIKYSLASIDKAKNLLNYQPKYSIADGIKEAIEWYWNNLK